MPHFASAVLPNAQVIAASVRHKPRRTGAFSKNNIASMQCPKGKQEALYWDVACRGFGLRALASGRRSWIFQYRDEHKRTRRMALGDVSAVSLNAARQAARRLAASVTQGANPSAQRKSKQTAPRVIDVIEAYLRNALARQRPRSFHETQRHLRKNAAPLHHDRAEAVRRADIASLLERVSQGSGCFAANRLRAALSSLWVWGMRAGLIDCDSNPVTFTLRHQEKTRERTLSDDELRAIWAATGGNGDYARIVRLCLLTGCRRQEIGGLVWAEILPDRLTIGADRMKAGAAHEVPLTAAIQETLPDRPEGAVGAVFGRTGTGFSGWSKSKELLDKHLTRGGASMPRWTLHDLRRTFSTRLHDAGAQPLVIEALLAHKQPGVAGVYNRASFFDAKRSALSRWHEILQQVVEA